MKNQAGPPEQKEAKTPTPSAKTPLFYFRVTVFMVGIAAIVLCPFIGYVGIPDFFIPIATGFGVLCLLASLLLKPCPTFPSEENDTGVVPDVCHDGSGYDRRRHGDEMGHTSSYDGFRRDYSRYDH